MEKYTWDDIIINPNSEQAKACIGKEVYCATNPTELLMRANHNNIFALNELLKIYPKSREPFKVNDAFSSSYTCIILKKEKSQKDKHKKYVPFSNKEEFLSAYEEHTNSMKKYGIWIFNKKNGIDNIIPCIITEMWGNGLIIGGAAVRTLWKYILDGFIFEDGTPCGKEINNEQVNEYD